MPLHLPDSVDVTVVNPMEAAGSGVGEIANALEKPPRHTIVCGILQELQTDSFHAKRRYQDNTDPDSAGLHNKGLPRTDFNRRTTNRPPNRLK